MTTAESTDSTAPMPAPEDASPPARKFSLCSVVRFTPEPGTIPPVNVAFIVWDGRQHLHVNGAFPRLLARVPNAPIFTVVALLEQVQKEVAAVSPSKLRRIIAAIDPRLSCSKPWRLDPEYPPKDMLMALFNGLIGKKRKNQALTK